MKLSSLTIALSVLACPLMTQDQLSLMLASSVNPAHALIKAPDDLKGRNTVFSVGGLQEAAFGKDLRIRVSTLDDIAFVKDVFTIAIDIAAS